MVPGPVRILELSQVKRTLKAHSGTECEWPCVKRRAINKAGDEAHPLVPASCARPARPADGVPNSTLIITYSAFVFFFNLHTVSFDLLLVHSKFICCTFVVLEFKFFN